MVDGVDRQFARPEGGRMRRIALVSGDTPQSRRSAHVNHRELAAGNPGVGSFDRPSERIVRIHLYPVTPQRLKENSCRSFSAVSHGHKVKTRVTQKRNESHLEWQQRPAWR